MLEPQARGVQGRAAGAALVRQGLAMERPIVDALAAKRRAAFRQMDTHLMGAPGFQPAFDQGVSA